MREALRGRAVGGVAKHYRQYLIVTDQEARSPDDVGAVVVRNGLRARDLAAVQLGTEDHVRIIAGDGKPAALLTITRPVGGNTPALAASVDARPPALAPSRPPAVHVNPASDHS